jgi:atypical dual specificity phosphatase
MTMVEAMALHLLFNDINQAKPSFFLDIRSSVAFAKCHLRGAHHIDAEQATDVEEITKELSKLKESNQIMLIFLSDNSLDASSVVEIATKAENRRAQANESNEEWAPRWKKIVSVSYCDFDAFYAAYPQCSSLYIGSDFPTMKDNRHGPVKVYSTDILPQFLYLGNYYEATDAIILRELGITHIVDATSENLSQVTAETLGLCYLPIPIWDMEGVNIAEHFEKVFLFITEAKERSSGRILVHCRAGISRSATFVLGYLMHAGHVTSLKEALKCVVEQRPYVLPNKSFREQLLEYEMTLFSTRSFECDNDLLTYVSTMNFCWSGIFSLETDFDKIPIIAASQRINYQKLLDAYPQVADGGANESAKPKKTFLKRGTGKTIAQSAKGGSTDSDGCGATDCAGELNSAADSRGGDAADESSAGGTVNADSSIPKVPKKATSLRELRAQALRAKLPDAPPLDDVVVVVNAKCAGSGAAAVRALSPPTPVTEAANTCTDLPVGDAMEMNVPI